MHAPIWSKHLGRKMVFRLLAGCTTAYGRIGLRHTVFATLFLVQNLTHCFLSARIKLKNL